MKCQKALDSSPSRPARLAQIDTRRRPPGQVRIRQVGAADVGDVGEHERVIISEVLDVHIPLGAVDVVGPSGADAEWFKGFANQANPSERLKKRDHAHRLLAGFPRRDSRGGGHV